MKIGITGASGFIGKVLMKRLVAEGYDLRLFLRPHHMEKRKNEEQNPQIEICFGDLTEEGDLHPFVNGLDIVFHIAGLVKLDAHNRTAMEKVNYQATVTLLKMCEAYAVKKVVHCSSIAALKKPEATESWDEECSLAVDDQIDYNRSKAKAEEWILSNLTSGMEVVIVNPTGVLGPDDSGPTLTGQNILDIIAGKMPATAGGGFNFVDVRDVVEGMWLAMENGRSGERYILGGHYHTLKDLTISVAAMVGKKAPKLHLPIGILRFLLPFVRFFSFIRRRPPSYTFEMLEATLDGEKICSDKAEKELGYTMRPWRETLEDTVNWFSTIHLNQRTQ